MAILKGTTTFANPNPSAASYSLAHTQDAGTDGMLLVALCMASTVNYTGVTYNGVAMTQQLNYASGSLSQRWAFFTLASPDTGSNTLTLNFSGSQFNSMSIAVMSFTGSGGVGVIGNNDVSATPHSRNSTIAENSIIYAMGVSVNAQAANFEIGGASIPRLFTHNTNRQVGGLLSNTGLPAGSTTVETIAVFGSISNSRIEILESAPTPPSSNGNFMLLF